MGIELKIEISQRSENFVIDQRTPIIAIKNGKDEIVNNVSPHRNSVEEKLKAIKAEKPPRFKFEWNPPEKYKSLFLNLKKKGKKELSNIFFHFFIKEDDQRLWNRAAAAENCEVKKVVSKGKGKNVVETVEIECGKFDTK